MPIEAMIYLKRYDLKIKTSTNNKTSISQATQMLLVTHPGKLRSLTLFGHLVLLDYNIRSGRFYVYYKSLRIICKNILCFPHSLHVCILRTLHTLCVCATKNKLSTLWSVNVKIKEGHSPKERRRCAHLPFIGR